MEYIDGTLTSMSPVPKVCACLVQFVQPHGIVVNAITAFSPKSECAVNTELPGTDQTCGW